MSPGDVFQALGDPRIVLLDQTHLAQVVVAVGIETGADKKHLGFEFFQTWNPQQINQLAYLGAFGISGHRHIDHVACLCLRAAVRVERVLKKTQHQNAVVAANDVFGAVAVMYVKVNDGDAAQTVARQSVFGGYRHAIENTKPHSVVATGVVTGRAYGAKSVFHLARHHRICRGYRGACGTQGRVP